MEPVANLKLTKAELWELMNNFDASYRQYDVRSSTGVDLGDDNSLAVSVSRKLHAAYQKLPA